MKEEYRRGYKIGFMVGIMAQIAIFLIVHFLR